MSDRFREGIDRRIAGQTVDALEDQAQAMHKRASAEHRSAAALERIATALETLASGEANGHTSPES